MMVLDEQCKDAGITVMNEIGLDPGIDVGDIPLPYFLEQILPIWLVHSICTPSNLYPKFTKLEARSCPSYPTTMFSVYLEIFRNRTYRDADSDQTILVTLLDASSAGLPGKLPPISLRSYKRYVLETQLKQGVLISLRNAASYYQGGSVVNVTGLEPMAQARLYPIYPRFAFDAYPDRDSTLYNARFIDSIFGTQRKKKTPKKDN